MSDLPRVTQILQAVGLGPDFSRVPADVLETARDRGSAVHEAIEAMVYGYFDPSAFPEEHLSYLDAYRAFLKDSGYEPKYAEVEVRHEAWRYRGHPDNVGWLLGKRTMLDLKSGAAEGVEYQLCGYREAWNAQHPTEPVEAIADLQLRRNGTYRFHEHSAADHTPVWYAAVTVFHAQRRS